MPQGDLGNCHTYTGARSRGGFQGTVLVIRGGLVPGLIVVSTDG